MSKVCRKWAYVAFFIYLFYINRYASAFLKILNFDTYYINLGYISTERKKIKFSFYLQNIGYLKYCHLFEYIYLS